MLGRLRMSITECLHEYQNLREEIFGTTINARSGPYKYDASKLQICIKEVVCKRLAMFPEVGSHSFDKGVEDAPLLEESGCKCEINPLMVEIRQSDCNSVVLPLL